MVINTLLIDDETDATEILERDLLRFCPFVKVIKVCHTPIEAITAIRNNKLDLIFLDVEMSGMSGFDLLEAIEKQDFDIIVTTAHSRYAADAYKVNAIDFLLKPYEPEQLKSAIKKVVAKNPKFSNNTASENVQENYWQKKKFLKIPHTSGFDLIKIEDILYCEAEGNITKFFLSTGKKHVASKTLGFYEEMLSNFGFFRVHAGYIVNLNFIEKYISSDRMIVMKTNTHVPIAQQRLTAFLTALTHFAL